MRADETGIAFSWRHTSLEYVCPSSNSYAVDTKTRKLSLLAVKKKLTDNNRYNCS